MASRVMRVDKEFKKWVEDISKALGTSPTKLTKRIEEIRPIEVKETKRLGQPIDDLMMREFPALFRKRRKQR